ncbi:DUF3919 family protein [Marinitoga arctica]
MINKLLKYYLLVFSGIILLIFFGFFILNKIYDKNFFVKDNDELIEKFSSNIPINIEIYYDDLPKVKLDSSDKIIKIWNIISNMPKFNYIEKENLNSIYGYIYFLNNEKKYFEISKNLIIDNLIYGYENDSNINFIRSYFEEIIFSPENISKLFNSESNIIIFNNSRGKYLNNVLDISEIKSIFNNSKKIIEAKLLGHILENNKTPLFTIKILREKKELIILNILSEKYFSVYYKNRFLYLLEGKIYSYLKNIF